MNIDTLKLITRSQKTITELEKKSNKEIAKLLIEHIWKDMDIFSPKSDLLEEAIERLRLEKL